MLAMNFELPTSRRMKWGMEVLSPISYFTNSNWLPDESRRTKWTQQENKLFENALAVHDKDTPDRWFKVAAMIPGKTVGDVIEQYKVLENDVNYIEAGLVPDPGYNNSSFSLDWVDHNGFDGLKQVYNLGGKRSSSTRPSSDQERKKGIPWTEDEHRRFLMGLEKYGKGDWRNISRHFVVSRTPTQVASHAQKYFMRQVSGGKDKRRPSIHDITTVNLTETGPPSPENNRPPSPHQSTTMLQQQQQQQNSVSMPKALFNWKQPTDVVPSVFNPAHGNMFMNPHEMASYGHQPQRETIQGPHIGLQNRVYGMQHTRHYPHG